MIMAANRELKQIGDRLIENNLLIFAPTMCNLKWSSTKSLLRGLPYLCFGGREIVKYLTSSTSRNDENIYRTLALSIMATEQEARNWCQALLSAHLVEDPFSTSRKPFAKSGSYTLTPKGLHILEQLMNVDSIQDDNLRGLFGSDLIPLKVLHLQRRPVDRSIIFSKPMITILFRHFAGPRPLRVKTSSASMHNRWDHSIPLRTVRSTSTDGINVSTYTDCFFARTVLDWLCDFTMILGYEEAERIAAHFVKQDLIAEVKYPVRCLRISQGLNMVDAPRPGHQEAATNEHETGMGLRVRETAGFCGHDAATYQITEKGARVARWSGDNVSYIVILHFSTGPLVTPELLSDLDCLDYILQNRTLRPLFLNFTGNRNFENSTCFYLDVQELQLPWDTAAEILPPFEDAFQHMYKLYFAPSCPKRLNLNENIAAELYAYLGDIMAAGRTKAHDQDVGGEKPIEFSDSQLQLMSRILIRVQGHISKILTAKFVPEFINTPYFFALKKGSYHKFEITADAASSLEQHASREEEGRHCVYISVSKKALVKSGN